MKERCRFASSVNTMSHGTWLWCFQHAPPARPVFSSAVRVSVVAVSGLHGRSNHSSSHMDRYIWYSPLEYCTRSIMAEASGAGLLGRTAVGKGTVLYRSASRLPRESVA